MTVNATRSQRQALLEGATDGKYRKVAPNWESVAGAGVERTLADRAHLHPPFNYDYITSQKPLVERMIPGT